MQIVINLTDKEYNDIMAFKNGGLAMGHFERIIANGTPIPEYCGRLIDAEELRLDIQTDEQMRLGEHLEWVEERIDSAPTIIETDRHMGREKKDGIRK